MRIESSVGAGTLLPGAEQTQAENNGGISSPEPSAQDGASLSKPKPRTIHVSEMRAEGWSVATRIKLMPDNTVREFVTKSRTVIVHREGALVVTRNERQDFERELGSEEARQHLADALNRLQSAVRLHGFVTAALNGGGAQ